MAVACTNADLVNGCASCYSASDLLAAIAVALSAINNRGAQDPEDIASDAACIACQSDKQLLVSLFDIIGTYAIDQGYFTDASELINSAACFACSPSNIVKAAIVQQICTYFAALEALQ